MKSATLRAENAQHIQDGPAKATSVVEADKEVGNNLVITVASDKGTFTLTFIINLLLLLFCLFLIVFGVNNVCRYVRIRQHSIR